ncbi:hypothetical protein RFI_10082, partial [Reticulomyxa filosa]
MCQSYDKYKITRQKLEQLKTLNSVDSILSMTQLLGKKTKIKQRKKKWNCIKIHFFLNDRIILMTRYSIKKKTTIQVMSVSQMMIPPPPPLPLLLSLVPPPPQEAPPIVLTPPPPQPSYKSKKRYSEQFQGGAGIGVEVGVASKTVMTTAGKQSYFDKAALLTYSRTFLCNFWVQATQHSDSTAPSQAAVQAQGAEEQGASLPKKNHVPPAWTLAKEKYDDNELEYLLENIAQR